MGDSGMNVDSVQSQYDWSKRAPSEAVIEAISAIENVEPMSLSDTLGTTLFDHIDPEALDAIVTANTDIKIVFTFGKYRVQIDGDRLHISDK